MSIKSTMLPIASVLIIFLFILVDIIHSSNSRKYQEYKSWHCKGNEFSCFNNNQCIPMDKFCDGIGDCEFDGRSDEFSDDEEINCEYECIERHDIFGTKYRGQKKNGVLTNGKRANGCKDECRWNQTEAAITCNNGNETVLCHIPFCGEAASGDIRCEFEDNDICGYTLVDEFHREYLTEILYTENDNLVIPMKAVSSQNERLMTLMSKIVIVPNDIDKICVKVHFGNKDTYENDGLSIFVEFVSLKCEELQMTEVCDDCISHCTISTSEGKHIKLRLRFHMSWKNGKSASALVRILHIRMVNGPCHAVEPHKRKSERTCTSEEFKCSNGQCLPISAVCNGWSDCRDLVDDHFCDQYLRCNEDELFCSVNKSVRCIPKSYSKFVKNLVDTCNTSFHDITVPTSSRCPSALKCRGMSSTCVSQKEICDGKPHCAYGDDEMDCRISCPKHCTCLKQTYKCLPDSLPNIPLDIPHIDISGHQLIVSNLCGLYRMLLIFLNVSNTNLKDIDCLSKGMLFPALRTLDLSHNHLEVIPAIYLPNIEFLYLDFNPIKVIYVDLPLTTLSLTFCQMNYLGWETLSSGWPPKAAMSTNHIPNDDPYLYVRTVKCFLKMLNLSHNKLSNFTYFGVCQNVLWLDLAYNNISKLSYDSFNGFIVLRSLNLSFNSLSMIGLDYFSGLNHLVNLQIDNNKIQVLHKKSFLNLDSLKILDISKNYINQLDFDVFMSQTVLEQLNLQDNNLNHLSKSKEVLPNLIKLSLRNNKITYIRPKFFESFHKLRELDLRGNNILPDQDMFDGLGLLKFLYVDNFVLCCYRPTSVQERNCLSPIDVFSSCTNLINIGLLQVCIWFTAVLSVFGNLYVMVLRVRFGAWIKEPRDILVSALCLSDLLMGAYLVMIAYTDLRTRGNYGIYHDEWTASAACKIAGVIATVSSEVSTLCILAITIDRYLLFRNPFSTVFKSKKVTVYSVICIWLFSTLLATFPLFSDIFNDKFYGSCSVCLSLPLTNVNLLFQGWEYRFGIFIVINLIIYIFIIIGQAAIFKQLRNYRTCLPADKKKAREIAVAKSLSAVVISNTLCWIPIICLGFLALSGIDISNSVYAWIIVCVLPINSAINPFLYTLTSRNILYKKSIYEKTDIFPTIHVVLVRPLVLSSCGLSWADPQGGMTIVTEPKIPLGTEVDVWFSDKKGWKEKSQIVNVFDEVIHCDVPPYVIHRTTEVKVHLTLNNKTIVTSFQTPYYVYEMAPQKTLSFIKKNLSIEESEL